MKETLFSLGATSRNLPQKFQTSAYFSSKYYSINVREQRWLNRKNITCCISTVTKMSDDEVILISPFGRLFFQVCTTQLGKLDSTKEVRKLPQTTTSSSSSSCTDLSNTLGQHVVSFIGGWNESETLIGLPEVFKSEGPNCVHCNVSNSEVGHALLHCCADTYYCSALWPCQRADWKVHSSCCRNRKNCSTNTNKKNTTKQMR
jgi:hypothetical protein